MYAGAMRRAIRPPFDGILVTCDGTRGTIAAAYVCTLPPLKPSRVFPASSLALPDVQAPLFDDNQQQRSASPQRLRL